SKEPFTIIMPPPNVTGELHMGHALTIAVEDLMIRWHRMLGDPSLYLPGTDHAGIATQVVVERQIATDGLSRHDLGRDKFIERVWSWVDDYGDRISRQTEPLGASCDWTRRAFTLDEGPARAVRTTFVNLYDKGLIYKGNRITNWCPRCRTALSDLEVKYQDESAHLYHIRYDLEDDPAYVVIATTRPETMLGDTAVAVNPEDDRYSDLIGRNAILPIVNRRLPIIGDDSVEIEFGTGALKVTPGHDPVDFEIGQRHSLDSVSILNLDGSLNENAGAYQGQTVSDARRNVVAQLEEDGVLERIEDFHHAVGHCDRCDEVVEPILSDQWYVRMAPLAKPARDAVADGRIKVVPERFTRVYFNWMDNIRDWPISRQLWWGHRIPVWYCDCGEQIVELEDPANCPSCGSSDLERDPDVLDTWFSSGLWTHSTLGWPGDTEDLDYFYPTSVMETGHDILFFWVARMIFFGIENMGDIPFHTVYLHGLVRDPEGVKMSKTKGNVVDPLELVRQYGADAVRFALTTGTSAGNDMRMNEQKLEASRNFANKLWNAARYVISNLENSSGLDDWHELSELEHREDRWIVSRLNRVAEQVDSNMCDYQFGEAQRVIHDFLWNEYCDWYNEMSKVRHRADEGPSTLPTLAHVLEKMLRMLHPFMPFVTEEIWTRLTDTLPDAPDKAEALIVAPYPTNDARRRDPEAEAEVESIIELVRAARNLRAEFRIQNNERLDAQFSVGDSHSNVFEDSLDFIASQAMIDLDITDATHESVASSDRAVQALASGTLAVSLGGLVDLGEETSRIRSELGELTKYEQRITRNLSNENFVNRAPEEVVDRERDRLAGAQQRISRLTDILDRLAG
ncbi:MAG: valine--tRNA ligase, partial [Dehalococcoidia bacterium]|nr:valine--tRNA ligase [Dehalococcoidia bacterium]